jgi:hypothetical protein
VAQVMAAVTVSEQFATCPQVMAAVTVSEQFATSFTVQEQAAECGTVAPLMRSRK